MSRKPKLWYLVVLSLILSLSYCSKEDADDQNVIVNIEDDFYIDLWEDLEADGREFFILVETINHQTCSNYELEYNVSSSNLTTYQRITLALTDLTPPADCIDVIAPAKAKIPIGSLAPGSYNFRINLKDAIVNNGQLVVSEEEYKLEMITDNGFELKRSELKRIPNQTIWGFVAYDDFSDQAAADDFIQVLSEMNSIVDIDNREGYSAGYYGYFSLAQQELELLNEDIAERYTIPFIFSHEEDLTSVMEHIDATCSDSPTLNIKLYTDKGVSYQCD